MPDFTFVNLTNMLKKKEKALVNYKKCDEHWLTICEGTDFYSYFKNVKIDKNVETEFERVELYRELSDEIIILK